MSAVAHDSVHTLILPLSQSALLVPSAMVAEVVNVGELIPTARPEAWFVGLMNWRFRTVPVISFDHLLHGQALPPNPRSKIVVFYPLEGRKANEFFGVLTQGEPQPRSFGDPESLSDTQDSDNPYLTVKIRLDKITVGIPRVEALAKLMYSS